VELTMRALLIAALVLLAGCGVLKLKNDTLICVGACMHTDTDHELKEKGEAPKDLPQRPAEEPATD
jgi:hypothetical protein